MKKMVSRSFSLARNSPQQVCECFPILSDKLAEGDEFFDIEVSSSDPRVSVTSSRINIKDDDST